MNLYIGNLNYKIKEQELAEVLSAYGAVSSVRIIKDKETGRSKGFGFAEMNNDAARHALQDLNGKELMGRQMVIKEAIQK